MKVGLFIDTWYPMVDGVIKVVDNYARRLVQYCDVVVFCPKTRRVDQEKDAKLPYKVVRCSSLPLITSDYDLPTPVLDPQFEAQLIKSGIDIVHIHSPFAVGLAGVLYAKIHKLPVVATLHSQYKQDFEKSLKFKLASNMATDTIMRVFNACDECWAVNGGIKDLYVHEYGLTAPCKVRLNATDHHPVPDPDAAARIVNETYGIPANATVFLFVGRINYIKNIDFIVRALAKAKAMGLKNFRMLFAGKGQDEEKLAALVQEKGLTEEVVMCGLVSDKEMLENLYSRAKLFLFPSLYDANSLVQIEAACQGTPTLFLEGAKTAATVTPGVNGYVCPPDEDSYARMIMDIMDDSKAYRRISAAARHDLYLNWDDVVRDIYEDYNTFIEAERQSIQTATSRLINIYHNASEPRN
jgi:glycosyltransferase involved in cell wall biosynthesis